MGTARTELTALTPDFADDEEEFFLSDSEIAELEQDQIR